MGRRKIQIAPIADDRNRSVTFLKRKNGLMKKAYELGILCGADVAVIVFSGNGKLYEFSSGDLNSTLLRYSKHDGPPHEHRGPADYDGSKSKGGPAPRTSDPAPVTEGDDEEAGDEEGPDEASDAAAAPSSDEKGKGRAWPPAPSTSTAIPSHSSHPPHPSHQPQQQPYPFDPSTMFPPYGFNGAIPGHPHSAAPLYAAAYNAYASRMGSASYPAFGHYPPGFPFTAAPAAPQPPTQTPFLAAAAAAAAAAEAYWGQQRASSAAAAPMSVPAQTTPKYDFAALTAAAAMGGHAIESAKSEPVPSSSTTGKRFRKADEDASTRARSKPRSDPRPASVGPTPTTVTTQEDHTPVSLAGDTTSASAEEQLQALRAFLPGFGEFDLSTKVDAGQGPDGGQELGQQGAGDFRWPTADG